MRRARRHLFNRVARHLADAMRNAVARVAAAIAARARSVVGSKHVTLGEGPAAVLARVVPARSSARWKEAVGVVRGGVAPCRPYPGSDAGAKGLA